jgi:hypothetical protein
MLVLLPLQIVGLTAVTVNTGTGLTVMVFVAVAGQPPLVALNV